MATILYVTFFVIFAIATIGWAVSIIQFCRQRKIGTHETIMKWEWRMFAFLIALNAANIAIQITRHFM